MRPGPRFEPGTGGLEALTTRPPHLPNPSLLILTLFSGSLASEFGGKPASVLYDSCEGQKTTSSGRITMLSSNVNMCLVGEGVVISLYFGFFNVEMKNLEDFLFFPTSALLKLPERMLTMCFPISAAISVYCFLNSVAISVYCFLNSVAISVYLFSELSCYLCLFVF